MVSDTVNTVINLESEKAENNKPSKSETTKMLKLNKNME